MEGTGRRGEWAWNSEKETERGGGWESRGVFSVRCLPGLNESTCFFGGGGGVTRLGGWTSSEEHSSPAGIISRKFTQAHLNCVEYLQILLLQIDWSLSLHGTSSLNITCLH